MKLNNKLFYFLLLIAFILFAVPVFFVGIQYLAFIFNIVGFFLFLFLNRFALNKKETLAVYIFFAISFTIRFCRIFTTTVMIFIVGILALVLLAAIIDLLMFLTSLVSKSKIKILTPFIFPLSYTLYNLLIAFIHFGNVFNLMNYFSLITPLAYNLSWASEFGLTFLLLLSYCLLLEIPFLKGKAKKIICGSLGALIIVSLFISGNCLKPKTKEPDFTLNVALAISEKRDFDGNSEVEMSKEDYQNLFISQVKEAKEKGADLLVFQEEYATFLSKEEESYLNFYSSVLKSYNLPALIGASVENSEGKSKNNAYYFDSEGVLLSSYQKVNVIPFIETIDYEGGTNEIAYFTTTIKGHSINISTVICFDLNNDLFLRGLNPNTELLLAPSWDWDDGNEEQLRTYVRSLEYNTTLIKHSYDGFSYVSTPTGLYGEIIDNRNKGMTVNVVKAPIYKKII